MAALLCRNQQTSQTLSCSFCTYENHCSFQSRTLLQSLLTKCNTMDRYTVDAAFREMADKLARLYPKEAPHQESMKMQAEGNPDTLAMVQTIMDLSPSLPRPEPVIATKSGFREECAHVPLPLLTFTSAGMAIFTFFNEENVTANTEFLPSLHVQNISFHPTSPRETYKTTALSAMAFPQTDSSMPLAPSYYREGYETSTDLCHEENISPSYMSALSDSEFSWEEEEYYKDLFGTFLHNDTGGVVQQAGGGGHCS